MMNVHRTTRVDTPRWRATATLTPGVQPRPRALTSAGRGGPAGHPAAADPGSGVGGIPAREGAAAGS